MQRMGEDFQVLTSRQRGLDKESQEWGARHEVFSIGHQFPYLCVSFLSKIERR
jgi:hypothetical protein